MPSAMKLTDKPDPVKHPDAPGWFGYLAPFLALAGAIAVYFAIAGAVGDSPHARAFFWAGSAVAAGVAALGVGLGFTGLRRGGHAWFERGWILGGIVACAAIVLFIVGLLALVAR